MTDNSPAADALNKWLALSFLENYECKYALCMPVYNTVVYFDDKGDMTLEIGAKIGEKGEIIKLMAHPAVSDVFRWVRLIPVKIFPAGPNVDARGIDPILSFPTIDGRI